jgi:hypothetical protein
MSFVNSRRVLKRPLLRFSLGLLCLLIALVLEGISKEVGMHARTLNAMAVGIAVLGAGFLIASALAVCWGIAERVGRRFPQQTQVLRYWLATMLMFALGAYSLALVFEGTTTDKAPLISRHHGWVPRSEGQLYYWGSIVFHSMIGAILIAFGIYAAVRGIRVYRARRSQ